MYYSSTGKSVNILMQILDNIANCFKNELNKGNINIISELNKLPLLPLLLLRTL